MTDKPKSRWERHLNACGQCRRARGTLQMCEKGTALLMNKDTAQAEVDRLSDALAANHAKLTGPTTAPKTCPDCKVINTAPYGVELCAKHASYDALAASHKELLEALVSIKNRAQFALSGADTEAELTQIAELAKHTIDAAEKLEKGD